MRLIGFLLFSVGIIMALICAAKLPAPNATWSDMYFIYGIAMVVALVGLVLLRLPQAFLQKCNPAILSDQTNSSAMELLQELLVDMHTFGKNINNLDKVEITKQVNTLLDTYVLPFAAAQHEIIDLLGQYQGVEVLAAAAQGERLLNRMWSAASDDHKAETIATYPKALAAFREAHRLCKD
ncbi:hypothetical protein [Candidatus Parabeggiatoa sp. HSG14]|uniref:hypothetical protein n=1 Tax=Candidatus Parabeggiatoa sp. HSG14 TaxID=3055593 RepID=UPI0025A6FF1F|nr:hypothetical protein [Thiotrichales bacterium HSG14]